MLRIVTGKLSKGENNGREELSFIFILDRNMASPPNIHSGVGKCMDLSCRPRNISEIGRILNQNSQWNCVYLLFSVALGCRSDWNLPVINVLITDPTLLWTPCDGNLELRL